MTAPGGDEIQVARTPEALAEALAPLREPGPTLALVPTMGALHEGHLSLLDRAGERADRVAISIYVNPLQFGPGEDLERYPRDEDRDLRLARDRGARLAFVPPTDAMFPGGAPGVRVVPGSLGDRLCGAFRPGHFEGVLTVVARLFGLFRPDVAVFGRKDYQQAVLVRRMVADLALGVEIDVAPLVREADGLAMSSRNVYLASGERAVAPTLFRALEAADRSFREGERDAERLRADVRLRLEAEPLFRPQYVEVVNPESLESVREARPGDLLTAAAHLGTTRLIDNLVLGSELPDPSAEPGYAAASR